MGEITSNSTCAENELTNLQIFTLVLNALGMFKLEILDNFICDKR